MLLKKKKGIAMVNRSHLVVDEQSVYITNVIIMKATIKRHHILLVFNCKYLSFPLLCNLRHNSRVVMPLIKN